MRRKHQRFCPFSQESEGAARQANEVQPQRMPQRWYEHCYSSGPRGRRSRCRTPAPPGSARCSRSRRRSERRRRRPRGASPAAAGASPAGDVTLTAERARLRAQLDRVNAEIDALKRSTRGVGDDYRLRARLADAEALARRLIDIEARLGLRAPAAKPGPLPVASPTDSPSDLQAKADILDDRSRRVRLEADALDHRVGRAQGAAGSAAPRRRAGSRSVRAARRLEAAGGEHRRAPTAPGTRRPAALPTGTGPQPPVDRPARA